MAKSALTPTAARLHSPLGVVPALLVLLVLEVVGYLVASLVFRGR